MTTANEFQVIPAEKVQGYLRLGLDGHGGSGKTWTALAIAQHLGSNIVVIDTERGRASKYARNFRFNTVQLTPPFTPERYTAALQAALRSGADVVIVDSFSHVWAGPGGVLEIVDNATQAASNKNAFTSGWSVATPRLNSMVDAFLQAPVHLIFTLRVKTAYELRTNARGKAEPVKVGLAPIVRDGFDYDMDVMGRLDSDHTLTITKTNCPDLEMDARYAMPGQAIAETILAWLNDADAPARPAPAQVTPPPAPASAPQTPPTTRTAPPPPPATNGQAKANPVSKIQRANLVSFYQEIYGSDPDTAVMGLHGLFQERFGHDLDAASYNEGAAVMAHLLQLKQQAAA